MKICSSYRRQSIEPQVVFGLLATLLLSVPCSAQMMAGTAKIDVTDYKAGPVNDPLFVKALVLECQGQTSVIVTVDAVAIGEIGRIKNDYLSNVRGEIQQSLEIPKERILVNASHCHGVVRHDIAELTVKAIRQASEKMVAVQVGVGRGHEDGIGENRRLILKDGREVDVRHAYAMPPDDQVASVGPIDPEIGILRLDALQEPHQPIAVIYNFACHPIQSVPTGANTADITGFASKIIEENLGDETVAFFLQGCGGDINPIFYKNVDTPRDAEPLGNKLGLSALRAIRKVKTRADSRFNWINETLELPRADLSQKIIDQEAEQLRLAKSLRGTTLSLKTFLPLIVKYRLGEQFPAYYSHRYLQEEELNRKDLVVMDSRNEADIKRYIGNVQVMEQLTRVNTNLALLRKHQEQNLAAEKRTIDVELIGLRVGDFILTSFPGELTVQIGLNLKDKSPHDYTFIAGYTNGYIYYAPTTQQLVNVGGAQEDSDCILAPHWQAIYENKAIDILNRL